MATWQAIAATGQAILGLLAELRPQPEFGGAEFALYQGSDLKAPMAEGIALYLYRVSVDGTMRNVPPRMTADGQRLLPPLPVELHYLLIPWARDAVKQQRLLGWAMRTLEDTRVLPAGLLNQFGPEPAIFRPEETVELVLEPLSLQDLFSVWDPFKPTIEVGVAYRARNILLDSAIDMGDGPLVQVRELWAGPARWP